MDRVDEFLGGRLRGRELPPDLRRLVELELDQATAERVPPFRELRVLGPSERHPLEGVQPLPRDPEPQETRANLRAIASVLEHVARIAHGPDDTLWGYWLHPEEPQDWPPLIVKLDSEGEFSIVPGASLVEAMIFDGARGAEVSAAIAYCERHRIPLAARSRAELRSVEPAVHPAALREKLYRQLLECRPRPAWADVAGAVPDAAPLGARATDPRVAALLVSYDLPADPMPLIRAADTGEGEVVLRAVNCRAEFVFQKESDAAWFLHEMRFFAAKEGAPACRAVPFGLLFEETRDACRARFGEPAWRSPVLAIERWCFGQVDLHVTYGKTGKPSVVRCMARAGSG